MKFLIAGGGRYGSTFAYIYNKVARFFKLHAFAPSGFKDYGSAMLRYKIGSLPFLGLSPSQEGIKFCHLATLIYNKTANAWREVSNMAEPRKDHSCGLVQSYFGREVVVVGGNQGETSSFEIFSLESEAWRPGMLLVIVIQTDKMSWRSSFVNCSPSLPWQQGSQT